MYHETIANKNAQSIKQQKIEKKEQEARRLEEIKTQELKEKQLLDELEATKQKLQRLRVDTDARTIAAKQNLDNVKI